MSHANSDLSAEALTPEEQYFAHVAGETRANIFYPKEVLGIKVDTLKEEALEEWINDGWVEVCAYPLQGMLNLEQTIRGLKSGNYPWKHETANPFGAWERLKLIQTNGGITLFIPTNGYKKCEDVSLKDTQEDAFSLTEQYGPETDYIFYLDAKGESRMIAIAPQEEEN